MAPRPHRRTLAALVVLASLLGLPGCGDGGGSNGTERLRVETIAGGLNIGDGAPATATFLDPTDLAVDVRGNVYVADTNTVAGGLIRRIDASSGDISTVGGRCDPRAPMDPEELPTAICDLGYVDAIAAGAADELFVATSGRAFRVDAAREKLTHIAGRGGFDCVAAGTDPLDTCLGSLSSLDLGRTGDLYLAEPTAGIVRRLGAGGFTTLAVNIATDECIGAAERSLVTDSCVRLDDVALDRQGNLFVVSHDDDRLRRVDAETGIVTTLAGTDGACRGERGDGGPAAEACFVDPRSVAVTADGEIVVGDDDRIRRIDRASGVITTMAARDHVLRLAAAPDGSVIFAESPGLVSRLDVASSQVTPVAGNGTWSRCGENGRAADACLGQAFGIALAADGSIDFADVDNTRIGHIAGADGRMTTIAGGRLGFCGDGGPAGSACFRKPVDVIRNADGNLYVADRGDDDQGGEGDIPGRIRRIDAATGIVTTIAGNCTRFGSTDAGEACLLHPNTLLFDASGGLLVGGDDGVHRIDLATGTIRDVVGGRLYAVDCRADGIAALDACMSVLDLTLAADGDLYVLDSDGARVRRVDAATGIVSTVAGNGSFDDCPQDDVPATSTCLFPYAIALDARDRLIVATAGVLRIVDPASGLIRTVAGSPTDCLTAPVPSERCLFPNDLEIEPSGRLIATDVPSRRIVRVTLP